jgi:hypothetical protein
MLAIRNIPVIKEEGSPMWVGMPLGWIPEQRRQERTNAAKTRRVGANGVAIN